MQFGLLDFNAQQLKVGEEGRRVGSSELCLYQDIQMLVCTSQVTITHGKALLYWKWLNICLPIGSSE